MSSSGHVKPIQVGLVSDEPVRLEGLASIFEQSSMDGRPRLIPVVGNIEELLSQPALGYLVVDLHSYADWLKILATITRSRPDIQLIVIGPGNNDELILQSIIAGARAYLDPAADPVTVREAIEVVSSGSIWASRHLLSRLIDRLMGISDTSLTNELPRLTGRERQVLRLILSARSNREIARELGIEEGTVQAHVGRLMRKTGAENRICLSLRALKGSFLLPIEREGRRQSKSRYGNRREPLALAPEPVTDE